MRELKKQYSDINSRMPRHSCCEVRVMQLHDILLLRTSAILPEAISAGGLTPTTDTSLFLTTYRGGSHLPADIPWHILPHFIITCFHQRKRVSQMTFPIHLRNS